jgi:hypothetical protein
VQFIAHLMYLLATHKKVLPSLPRIPDGIK